MLAAPVEDGSPHPDEDVLSSILKMPLANISMLPAAAGPILLSLMQTDRSMTIACKSDAEHLYSTEEEERFIRMIRKTDVSDMYQPLFYMNCSNLVGSIIKPQTLLKNSSTSPGAKQVYDRIQSACASSSMRDAAVSASVKKPFMKCWNEVPGTPLSEAWETMSGPLSRATPTATPIRKVILNFTPKQDFESKPQKQRVRKPEEAQPERILKVKLAPKPSQSVPVQDLRQRLSKIFTELQSGADETQVSLQLCSLIPAFRFDLESAKEWVCEEAPRLLHTECSKPLKSRIVGLCLVHFIAVKDWTEYSKSLYSCFTFLAENVLELVDFMPEICHLISSVHIEDELAMKLTSSLYALLPEADLERAQELTRIGAALASMYTEAKDYFYLELMALKSDPGKCHDALLLARILQSELTHKGSITEKAAKDMILPFTEELYKKVASDSTSGIGTLAMILRGLTSALQVVDCPLAALLTKYVSQFAIMVVSSHEKLGLEHTLVQNLLEALTSLVSFLCSNERLGPISEQISFDCINSSKLPEKEKSLIISAYCCVIGAKEAETDVRFAKLEDVAVRLISSGFLSQTIQSIILIHLRFSSDSNLQIRIKAFRGLLAILHAGDQFLCKEGFGEFLASKINDSSVTMRDIALEFLSKCYKTEQLIELGFVQRVTDRLLDSSTLVRKRAVRLHRDLLSANLPIENLAEVVAGLLRCVYDEESSVSTLASKIMKEQWLPKITANLHDRQGTVQFVALIIRVIRILGNESEIIQKFLSANRQDPTLAEKIKELATNTVDVLFESLIGAVENSNWDAVRFILNAIDIFVGQEYVYLSSHLRLLYELTKTDEMVSLEFGLKLLKMASLGSEKSALMQLQGCQQHMALLILKGSEPVVRNAIEFLFCYVEIMEDNSGVLGSLWDRFYGFLESKKDIASNPANAMSAICRGIFSLGCLAKCALKSTGFKENSPVEKALILFTEYYKNGSITISYYALQSIASLLPEAPRMAYREDVRGTIESALKHDRTDYSVCMLRSFISLIEQKTLADNISFETSMTASELNYSASIIQSHISRIVEFAFLAHKESQLLTLKIISFALLRGLCHPQQVLPAVISLSTSPERDVYLRAAELLKSASETHSAFLFSNYTIVLQSLFKLHSKYDNPKGFKDEAFEYESLIGEVYSGIRTKRQKRNDLVDVIIKEFEESSKVNCTAYSKFLLEILAMLPMKTFEEVACLLTRVNDLAMNYSSQCLEHPESHSEAYVSKTSLVLSLRGYLACSFGMTLERCDKALSQDAFGKASVVSKALGPFDTSAVDRQPLGKGIDAVRALLDEQLWIESSSGDGKVQTKPTRELRRPNLRPKKRRKRLTELTDDDGDEVY